jgi:hypothetical protein
MLRRIVSRTGMVVVKMADCAHCGSGGRTLEASQTERECSPYCSTRGKMLVVTIRCALLKLESISAGVCQSCRNSSLAERNGPCNVRVIDCSSFSSSSVRVRFLGAAGPGRDMLSGR